MKTIGKIIICIVLFTTIIVSTANAGNIKLPFLKNILHKVITYPDFAKVQKIEGIVLVSFDINKDGTISIKMTNESNVSLKDYVVNKLKELKVIPLKEVAENTINVKFEFKLECGFTI